jgi:hypothetical protein
MADRHTKKISESDLAKSGAEPMVDVHHDRAYDPGNISNVRADA